MTRVGCGKGEYVLDMEYKSAGDGVGQWDMSYRYVGLGEGQFSLVDEGAPDDRGEEDVERPALPEQLLPYLHSPYAYGCGICLGVLFLLWLAWLLQGPIDEGPPLDNGAAAAAAAMAALTTTVQTRATTTTVAATTTIELPMTLSVFADIVHHTFIDGEVAWLALAGSKQSVYYPVFKNFTGLLLPPVDPTEAWFVFSQMDSNHDLALAHKEFKAGLHGEALSVSTTPHASPALVRASTTSTATSTLTTSRTVTTTRTVTTMALDISLQKFAGLLEDSYGSEHRAWKTLFMNSSTVDFQTFSRFSASLWPPLNQTQAWLVFSYLDVDHDLSVKETEFFRSLVPSIG